MMWLSQSKNLNGLDVKIHQPGDCQRLCGTVNGGELCVIYPPIFDVLLNSDTLLQDILKRAAVFQKPTEKISAENHASYQK